jgi:hypothetical protein
MEAGAFGRSIFFPGVKHYWIFAGWPKGLLYTHDRGDEPVVANPYKLTVISGVAYRLLEVRA